MPIIRFIRFTKPQTLQRVGRDLLVRFFAQFEPELRARGLALPAPTLPDAAYCQALAGLLLHPEALPAGLNEALFALDEMAGPEGQERLEQAMAEASLTCPPDSTREELALQLWLAAPALLARKHNEQRLRRLTAFAHFGTATALESRRPFTPPTPGVLAQLTAALDGWFARHHRGQQTTRVEVYPLNGEYWFLIRHGDTFARTPKVERQHTEILHFRPEKDDVAVYSPAHDEIRLNTRTRGEQNLYREEFGLWLRGDRNYFSEHRTYTLEPLRTDGPDALAVEGLEGIARITLRELELVWDQGRPEVLIREAEDLFRAAPAGSGMDGLIPKDARLARAALEFEFTDSPTPRMVHIRPPNLLKLGRHCDYLLVDRYLCKSGIRARE